MLAPEIPASPALTLRHRELQAEGPETIGRDAHLSYQGIMVSVWNHEMKAKEGQNKCVFFFFFLNDSAILY